MYAFRFLNSMVFRYVPEYIYEYQLEMEFTGTPKHENHVFEK
jgi:hypothetical protein